MTEELRRHPGRFIDLLGNIIPQAGNLRNIGDYFALGGEVFTILKEWGDIEEPVETKTGLQARLRLVVRLGELYTTRSPSTDDDKLVALLKTGVENDGVMEFVASVFARFKAQAGDNPVPTIIAFQKFVESDAIQASAAEVAAEQQIDLATIMEIIQLVMKIIAMFKSPVPTNPASPSSNDVLNF